MRNETSASVKDLPTFRTCQTRHTVNHSLLLCLLCSMVVCYDSRVCGSNDTNDTGQQMYSLDVFSAKARDELKLATSISEILSSQVLELALLTESRTFWNQLSLQDDPLVKAIGLLCLKKHQPDLLHVQAARSILTAQHFSGVGIELAGTILSEPLRDSKKLSDIANVIGYGSHKRDNRLFLLSVLGEHNVVPVFNEVNLDLCEYAAVIDLVDHVGAISGDTRKTVDEGKFQKAVSMLRLVPGLGRCVYLMNVQPISQEFAPTLKYVMADESVDDGAIYALLIRRGAMYTADLSAMLPSLPESRQKTLRRYLSRQRK